MHLGPLSSALPMQEVVALKQLLPIPIPGCCTQEVLDGLEWGRELPAPRAHPHLPFLPSLPRTKSAERRCMLLPTLEMLQSSSSSSCQVEAKGAWPGAGTASKVPLCSALPLGVHSTLGCPGLGCSCLWGEFSAAKGPRGSGGGTQVLCHLPYLVLSIRSGLSPV